MHKFNKFYYFLFPKIAIHEKENYVFLKTKIKIEIILKCRIEDHDDLIPIFNKHNNHLTDIYGKYHYYYFS